jgi:hypothetical protein
VCIFFAILLLRSYISGISESPRLHPEIKFAQHFMLCITTQYSLAVILVIENFFESWFASCCKIVEVSSSWYQELEVKFVVQRKFSNGIRKHCIASNRPNCCLLKMRYIAVNLFGFNIFKTTTFDSRNNHPDLQYSNDCSHSYHYLATCKPSSPISHKAISTD